MSRIFPLLITVAFLSGCAGQGELTSPCACLETPINAVDDLPA